jgi:hypothetical protein
LSVTLILKQRTECAAAVCAEQTTVVATARQERVFLPGCLLQIVIDHLACRRGGCPADQGIKAAAICQGQAGRHGTDFQFITGMRIGGVGVDHPFPGNRVYRCFMFWNKK